MIFFSISPTVMMPLWIFTLGSTIFDRGHLTIPYARIAYMAVGLVVPLSIGLLIQRYLPKLAKLLVRILKTFSSLLIIFIIIFAIVTNFYLFELFTWQVSSKIDDLRDVHNVIGYHYQRSIKYLKITAQSLRTDLFFFSDRFSLLVSYYLGLLI